MYILINILMFLTKIDMVYFHYYSAFFLFLSTQPGQINKAVPLIILT